MNHHSYLLSSRNKFQILEGHRNLNPERYSRNHLFWTFHLTREGTKAQRSEVTCPKSHSLRVTEPRREEFVFPELKSKVLFALSQLGPV